MWWMLLSPETDVLGDHGQRWQEVIGSSLTSAVACTARRQILGGRRLDEQASAQSIKKMVSR
jgi:hypothetical protein